MGISGIGLGPIWDSQTALLDANGLLLVVLSVQLNQDLVPGFKSQKLLVRNDWTPFSVTEGFYNFNRFHLFVNSNHILPDEGKVRTSVKKNLRPEMRRVQKLSRKAFPRIHTDNDRISSLQFPGFLERQFSPGETPNPRAIYRK